MLTFYVFNTLTFCFCLCLDLEGGKHFFNTVKEGDSVLFATEDEQEAHNWVMAFYRATGQAHKPTPPVTTGKNSVVTKVQGGIEKTYPSRQQRFILLIDLVDIYFLPIFWLD